MKKQFVICVLALGFLGGPQAPADSEWGVFGSFWSPSDGDTGVGGGAKIGIPLVDRMQLDLRYAIINGLIDSDNADLDVQPVEFGFQYAIPVNDRVESYVGIGGGYYMMDGEVEGTDARPDDEFGLYASAGVEFILSRSAASYGQTSTKLFLEGLYRSVEAADMKVSGGDADLSGFGFQAGLLVGW